MNVILSCVHDGSPISTNGNSELGSNMVLVFTFSMKGIQNLKYQI